MTGSAIFLGVMGIALIFMPDEIKTATGLNDAPNAQLLLKLMGALYFGFAMLNWMSRFTVIGGIYNKPVSIANFTHFAVGALSLIKMLLKTPNLPQWVWVLTAFYTVFAILFGVLFYRPAGK